MEPLVSSGQLSDLLLGLAYGPAEREMQATRLAWVEKTRSADQRRGGRRYGRKLGKETAG